MSISKHSFQYCLCLLAMITSSNAIALGLGEITLNSFLGEELNASIPINDADTPPDIGCFIVKDLSEDAALRRVSAKLAERKGQLQLTISTRAVLTEPIITLNVNYLCEPYLSRDYVLLLDPAPLPNISLQPELAVLNNLEESSPAAKRTPQSRKKTNPNDAGGITVLSDIDGDRQIASQTSVNAKLLNSDDNQERVIAKPRTKLKAKLKSTSNAIDDQLNAAYAGNTSNAGTPDVTKTTPSAAPSPPTNTAKPYLIISGNRSEDVAPGETARSGLILRLETAIDTARVEQAPTDLTHEEVSDEVTVMANRLAHLEKQILSLQTINTQLKTQLETRENEGFKFSETQLNIVRYVLYALGLIVILMIAAFVRRELIKRRLERDEAHWFTGNEDASAPDEPLMPASKVSEAIFKSTVLDAADEVLGNSPPFSTSELNQTNPHAGAEEEAENVLDHAEVFIAHGRTHLAIQLLQNHLEEFPTESPTIWLRLLALLAAENSEEEYERAVTECNQFFNMKLPRYADALLDDDSSIEDYPHIIQRLEGVWGSQFAVSFLNDLIYNQQSQPREGFARNTFVELYFLRQVASILAKDFPVDGTTEAYSAAALKPVLQNIAINESLFDDAVISSSLNATSSVDEATSDALSGVLHSNQTMDALAASEAPPYSDRDDDLVIASFNAEDYDENEFIFETVAHVEDEDTNAMPRSDSQMDNAVYLEDDSIEAQAPSHTPSNLDRFDALNAEMELTEEITFSDPSDLASEDDNSLNFDMSGFEQVLEEEPPAELDLTTQQAHEDTGNLIEFDWDLTDKDNKTDQDNQSASNAKKQTAKRQKVSDD